MCAAPTVGSSLSGLSSEAGPGSMSNAPDARPGALPGSPHQMTPTGHREARGLSDRQLRAVGALASGMTHQRAAETAGVRRETVTRWMRTEPMREAVADLRRGAISEAGTRLAVAMSSAAEVLIDLAVDLDAPPHVRLGAAGKVLDHGARLHMEIDLDPRLARLEQLVEEMRA